MTVPQNAVPTRIITLLTVGVWFAAVYVLFLLFYTQLEWSAPRMNRELFVWPVTLGLMALYWMGYRVLIRGDADKNLKWLLGGTVLFGLIALFVPPFHSTDVFGYINRGWQQVGYGVNPYAYTVDAIRGWESDPMFTDHWVNNPSPYGFLYMHFSKWLCLLGAGNKVLTLFVFKLANTLVFALTGLLVWLTARRLEMPRPDLALYLFLWNPLIIVHHLMNGHNDLLMGLFIVLGLYTAVAKKYTWVLPALVAATLVKYAALVLIPIGVFYLIKQRAWVALIVGLGLSVILLLVTGLPYVMADGNAVNLAKIQSNAFVSHSSLHSFFHNGFKQLSNMVPALYPLRDGVKDLLKNTLLIGFMVFYAIQGLRQIKRAFSAQAFIFNCTLVVTVLICVVSPKFYPWYMGIMLPMAVLLPLGHWLRKTVVLITVFQLLSLTFVGQAHFLNYLLMLALPMVLVWQNSQADPALTLTPKQQPGY